ncbi:phosphatidylinositol phosphate synthase [Auraticoccus monumenti]|uniref:Phosphatidylinositol phosphate synthase n=1 Tax=Auraticoccus monumenti TaxID=675864 RepID=A0A1G7C3N9_9ACTN|nr:CDP-alcohol phosphatidyltransferase family protein [Auraticoccus monumenti]SDE33390.1 CDP-diacylglycerol inositol 3-phosphatidyltransferase [Auraticoccus monumenti]
MLQHLRSGWAAAMAPPASLLLRLGVTPDVVTWTGTALTVAVAVVFLPLGWLWQAALLLTLLVMSDGLDGQMARMSGRPTRWGAFLDSTLDRVADGAVLGGVALHLALADRPWSAGLALWALVAAQVTSYVKARAESVGLVTTAGLGSRAERLVLVLLALLLEGVGVPRALDVGVLLLALLTTVTVVQRVRAVHRSAAPDVGGSA